MKYFYVANSANKIEWREMILFTPITNSSSLCKKHDEWPVL